MRVGSSRLAGALGTFVALAAATLPYPLLDAFLVERLGASQLGAALYVSVNLGAYVVAGPLAGRWTDGAEAPQHGLAAGFAAQGVLLGVQPWVPSLGGLLAVRFLEGCATMLALTSLHATVLDRGDRGTGAGTLGVGLALGVAAGSAAGGALYGLAPAAPFLAGAALLLVAAPVALLWTPEAGRAEDEGPGLGELLARRPRLWVPVGFSLVDRLTVGFLVTGVPLTLADLHGFAPARVGLAMTVFLLAFAAGQVPAGRASSRLGRLAPLAAGSLAYGGLVAAIPHAFGGLLWTVLVAAGLAGAVMFAPSLALTGDLVPEHPGRGVALFHQAGSLGFAVGPVGAGALLEALGPAVAFLAAGAVQVLAVAGLLAAALATGAGRLAAEPAPG
jgi:MFS family permease